MIRRFHLGARHAADTSGVEMTTVAEQLRTGVNIKEASINSKGFKFRVVQPLVKDLKVKTQYGTGTILKLRGLDGVEGFSLVVRLDSWAPDGVQKPPLLYCEADEVISIVESSGSLSNNGSRMLSRNTMETIVRPVASNGLSDGDGQEQEDDRSTRPTRACRSIKNDKGGNVVFNEFHLALHHYLWENNESNLCRWQNDGLEFSIYKEDKVAQGVRSLMGIHALIRERKRQKQWLLKELYNHGFVRTRSVYFFVGYMLYAVLVAHLKYPLICFFFPPSV